MAQITINGKEYPVVFNMTAILCYEEIVDKSFFGEDFARNKERMALILAAVYAADEKSTLDIEELKHIQNWQEIAAAFNTIMALVSDFFALPKVVADAEKQDAAEQEEKKGEAKPKN